jgi:DNA polymerase-3 subunit alpha
MAAKSSIKDVARVMDLPLQESNMLSKLVSDRPGILLKRLLTAPLSGENSLEKEENLQGDDLENAKKLRKIYSGNDLPARVLKEAIILEGSVRGTGIHASAIIIAPKDLTEIVPISSSKETELYITQYDGKVIEDSGIIKMDFLGLKTLSIIRDALIMIKQNHNIEIDIDNIALDDKKTYELFQKGNSIAVFQFEAPHVLPILKDLKPTAFEDLIALNALNRPGPSAYIPNYIARKHGKEKVVYDLPEVEEFLSETYGITVYQEQVMLLSQKLAGFSKGDADVLRKAMGKKDRATLDKMKSKFIDGAIAKGLPKVQLEKIWTDWEKFAQYAFNKSHSTCYALVAYQTAYLKANYPQEFMASVLTHNLEKIDKITFYMDECRRMGMDVLGPDVNESEYQFSVNKKGELRFGMGAVKGVGESAVIAIVEERNKNGAFKNIFDFVRRINLRAANKKTFESLAYSGGFDSFGIHRATYFFKEGNDAGNFLERVIRYGSSHQEGVNSAQVSMFGDNTAVDMPEPKIPVCEEFSHLEQLKNEKDVVGFFISGHPLDTYKLEMNNFCHHTISDIKNIADNKNKELVFGGIVTNVHNGVTKTGNPWGKITIEDYRESAELAFFGEDYVKFKQYMVLGLYLYVKGKIGERYRDSGNFEFKTTNIQLLSELRDKLARSITVNIKINELNDDFILKFNEILLMNSKAQPRNCTLQFKVLDTDENISVVMHSKKIKVNPNNELLDLLELNHLEYKLN